MKTSVQCYCHADCLRPSALKQKCTVRTVLLTVKSSIDVLKRSRAGRAMRLVEFNRAKCRDVAMGGEATTHSLCIRCLLFALNPLNNDATHRRSLPSCTRDDSDRQWSSSRDVSHGRPTEQLVVLHSVQSHSQKNRQTRAIHAEDVRPSPRTHCRRPK